MAVIAPKDGCPDRRAPSSASSERSGTRHRARCEWLCPLEVRPRRPAHLDGQRLSWGHCLTEALQWTAHPAQWGASCLRSMTQATSAILGEAALTNAETCISESLGVLSAILELFWEHRGTILSVILTHVNKLLLRPGVGKVKRFSAKKLCTRCHTELRVEVHKVPREAHASGILTHGGRVRI